MTQLIKWLTRRLGWEDYENHVWQVELGPVRLWFIPTAAYGDYPDRDSYQVELVGKCVLANEADWLFQNEVD